MADGLGQVGTDEYLEVSINAALSISAFAEPGWSGGRST
jgi:hypothetical protein